jgi:chemotaxis protein MotA
MDLASILGLIIFAGAAYLGLSDNPDWIEAFVSSQSVYIVVLGSFGIVLFRSTLGEFLLMFRVCLKMFRHKIDKPEDLIDQLVELAGIARKDGMIALQNAEIDNRLLSKGINALVDGTDPMIIRTSLERDMYITAKRHESARGTLKFAGDVAPAMGMVGTLIGLINLLGKMNEDPESIGPNMSTALLTTLYGAVLANALFLPAAEKLENFANQEMRNSELIIEGIMFIQTGGNPRLLGDLLSSYLSPKAVKKREEVGATG